MGKVKVDISTSLDGFITGPDDRHGQELGAGGEQLHEWVFGLASWRKPHGLEGGETGPDDDVIKEASTDIGAVVMGDACSIWARARGGTTLRSACRCSW